MQSENAESGKDGGGDQSAERPPKVRTYKIEIDKKQYETQDPKPTGAELLALAGKTPPEQFALYLRVKGNQPKRIGLTEVVDLGDPGVERFVTLPLDQTEG